MLTQARLLWLYVQWLFVPDISAFGLFHDDIELSTGIVSPPSTLIAIIGLLGVAGAALLMRRKAPVFSFAVLFFLASHALESSAFPLEMVFEHRNYLASFGPLFLLAYLITIASARMNVRPLATILGVLLLLSYQRGDLHTGQQLVELSEFYHQFRGKSSDVATQQLHGRAVADLSD